MEPWQWAQSFDEAFHYSHMTTKLAERVNSILMKTRHLLISSTLLATFYKLATLMPRMRVDECRPDIPPRSYEVDLLSKRYGCRRFQTLHYPCAHVMSACAKVSLNVEQFIDEMNTLERTLRVWENKLPVMPNLSTWENLRRL
ncbi:hypothetical protein GOBAR_DD04009 [Gossypium barbadense]|nr:hypothetical protein GOBAR_DD04009 [Gossypium barbadense]